MGFKDSIAQLIAPPRADVARDMAWLRKIPSAPPPPGYSSIFGSHVATNKAECPFSYLAEHNLPETVRQHHGIMSASMPDAVYTRDPVLARQILQNKAHVKAHRWPHFHRRLFGPRVQPCILTYRDPDDPALVKLRRLYTSGMGEALDRHSAEIEAHIERWIDDVVRGDVEIVGAVKRLMAEIVHLLAFGELPANPLFAFIYVHYTDFSTLDTRRRLAHLLWPVLDRLPTPYGLAYRARALATKWLTASHLRQHRHKADSFLGRLYREGAADNDPGLPFRAMPLFVNAANAALPAAATMALTEIAQSSDLQQRIVDENLFGAVLKETLRLYAPVSVMARITTSHVESDSAALEAMASGEGQVYINIAGVHRDPRGWNRPDDFMIDRWRHGRTEDVDPERRLYVPFGLGARSCVAASFSTRLLESFLRLVLARRIVTNPSGRPPRLAQGSHLVVRGPFVLHFAERPSRATAAPLEGATGVAGP